MSSPYFTVDEVAGGVPHRNLPGTGARKAVAIGAFSLGTFGLGFTLGGLVFSRRRRHA
jgi:hypothetical protein